MRTNPNKDTRGPVCAYDDRLHFGAPWRAQISAQPLKVGMTAGLDLKHQKLRGLITVKLMEPRFESGQLVDGCLEQKQSLG